MALVSLQSSSKLKLLSLVAGLMLKLSKTLTLITTALLSLMGTNNEISQGLQLIDPASTPKGGTVRYRNLTLGVAKREQLVWQQLFMVEEIFPILIIGILKF